MRHIRVCSWAQLHLLANTSLFAAKLPVSRGRPLRIIPGPISIFTAHSISEVHGQSPSLAPKFAKAHKEKRTSCNTLSFSNLFFTSGNF